MSLLPNADLIQSLHLADRHLAARHEFEEGVDAVDGPAWYSHRLTGAIVSARLGIRNLVSLLERIEDGSDEPTLD